MKVHNLKTIQPYYSEVEKGIKTFELRKDDRNYQVGDILKLFEGTKQVDDIGKRINQNHIHVYVSYKLEGGSYGLEKGYCILGLSKDSDIWEFKGEFKTFSKNGKSKKFNL